MVDFFDTVEPVCYEQELPTGDREISVTLKDFQAFLGGGAVSAPLDGDKFYAGFGDTVLHYVDYWTLRARSHQLFNDNLYARGLLRRLITNIINTGLHLEHKPKEKILGYAPDALSEFTEDVEDRFELYCADPLCCDYRRQDSFGKLQKSVKLEALLDGDVLIVLRPDPETGIPRVQIVSGSSVQSPLLVEPESDRYEVVDGVKIRKETGEHVGFYIRQENGDFKYLPAFGSKSGRRIAWLVYGTDKRHNQVRGIPLLQLVMQSLKEIDRHRDAVQRKAVVNSILAMWIEKSTDKMGTNPLQGGAVRRDTVATTDADGRKRSFTSTGQIPGMVIEELQEGEKPHGFTGASNIEFGPFEAAVLQAVAWAQEIPPEILMLAFDSNYSASQAALNEFKIFLNRERQDFGENFCQHIFTDWFISENINGKIKAKGFIESWDNVKRNDEFNAWITADWAGAIKPSTDIRKQSEGYVTLVKNGWVTNDRAARELTGTKFRDNIEQLKRENQQIADAIRPLLELEKEMSTPTPGEGGDKPEPKAMLSEFVRDRLMNLTLVNNIPDNKRLQTKSLITRQDDGSLLVEDVDDENE